jgi:hypothetical protein
LASIKSIVSGCSLVLSSGNQYRTQSKGRFVVLRHLLFLAAVLFVAAPTWAGDGKKGIGEPTCNGDYGTSVKFEKSPQAAANKAAKEEKLVLVIHISGYFEEPDYT